MPDIFDKVKNEDIFDKVSTPVSVEQPSFRGAGVTGSFDPELRKVPERTVTDKFLDTFREQPEKIRAKAQNAMALSEIFNVPPSQAYDFHDEFAKSYAEKTGLALETTPSEFYSGLFLPPIAAGLATAPVATLLGISGFEALGEAESAVINYVQGTEYKAFQRKGLVDLLPEDVNAVTEGAAEVIDFLGKAIVLGGVFKRVDATAGIKGDFKVPERPTMPSSDYTLRLTKQMIEEYKAPKSFFIEPTELRRELQTGGVLSETEVSVLGELGVTKGAIRQALKEGVTVEVPAERIVTLRDRPWFATVKKIMRIDPAQESRIEAEGVKTFKIGGKEVKAKTREEAIKLVEGRTTAEIAETALSDARISLEDIQREVKKGKEIVQLETELRDQQARESKGSERFSEIEQQLKIAETTRKSPEGKDLLEAELIAEELQLDLETVLETPPFLRTGEEKLVVDRLKNTRNKIQSIQELENIQRKIIEKSETVTFPEKPEVEFEQAFPELTKTKPIPEGGKINAITRGQAGNMIAKGDETVLEHIRSGLKERGIPKEQMQDAIRNQIQTEIAEAPKGEARQAIRENISKLEPQIDAILSGKEARITIGKPTTAKKEVTTRAPSSREIKKAIKDERINELNKRREIVNHIKKKLPVALRGQFLNAVATSRTPSELKKTFERIAREVKEFEEMQAKAKVEGALRSKIAFIKKLGELNQTVVNDVKNLSGINKPLNKMNESELDIILKSLKERMDFKVKSGAIKPKESPKPEITEEQFQQNRDLNIDRKKGFADTVKRHKDSAVKETDKILGVISTRLKDIDPSLKSSLRKFEINLKLQEKKDLEVAETYLGKVKNISKEDFADLDIALKNGDIKKINEINRKYGMELEYNKMKVMLDDIYKRADEVGFDIGYTENYFPRTVNNAEAFMEHVSGRDDFSILDEAISRKENALGRALTVAEKSNIVNNMMRGYKGGGITLSEIGAMKARKIDFVDAELNQFYSDSNTALIGYIIKTNEAIEARKLFGKSRPVDEKTDEFNNIDDSIGFYITDLLSEGKIKASQEKIVRDILFARLTSTGTSGAVGVFKNLGHLTVMGSPFNAVTQIGDLGFAIYNSPKEFLPATLQAIVGKSKIKKEDLGINRIAVEFSDSSRASKAVDRVFRLIGLTRIDSIGKEALVNSAIAKYQRLSKNPDDKFLKDMDTIFGNESAQLIADLKSGEITENVKYLALNELLDFQPVALSEVPEQYLRATNGKIFYMLKTWTIKMLDVYRNEVFDVMKTDKAQGIKNMIGLSAALMAMNATADEIKDLMLGRETTLKDRTVDNMLKLIGFTRYSTYQVQRDGLGSTIAEQILPPTAIIDNVSKDVITLLKDYDSSIDVSQFKSIQNIPVGGKLYYWWFGKGSKQNKSGRSINKTSVQREASR